MARQRLDAAEWAVLIDEWRRSGLSLPAFCKRRGLSRGTMQNWVYKPASGSPPRPPAALAARRGATVETADVPTPPPAFLPVRLAEITTPMPPTGRAAIGVLPAGVKKVVPRRRAGRSASGR